MQCNVESQLLPPHQLEAKQGGREKGGEGEGEGTPKSTKSAICMRWMYTVQNAIAKSHSTIIRVRKNGVCKSAGV